MPEPSNNLISDFALHPEKWAAANKEHVAKSLGTTVEELEARISKATDEAPKLTLTESLKRLDMPAACLPPGKLGQWTKQVMPDFPLAYSWLPMLTAANVLIKPDHESGFKTNLFVAIIGDPETGKSEAINNAMHAFRLKERGLVKRQSFGSAEGMLETIGNQAGNPYLWSPDELAHVMLKAAIKGSSYYTVLNTLFGECTYSTTVTNRKPIAFHAWLSMLGGLVEQKFGEYFTGESEAGLYSRFLFTLCPSDFNYRWRPMRGEPLVPMPAQPFDQAASAPAPLTPGLLIEAPKTIHKDVLDAREQVRTEGVKGRVLELVMRCAMISAAYDEQKELRASYMEPFWELARYQMKVRDSLRPNPGMNQDAQCQSKIMNFLSVHAAKDWIASRDACMKTHAYGEFGTPMCMRVLKSLVDSGQIDEAYMPAGRNGKKKRLIRLPQEEIA